MLAKQLGNVSQACKMMGYSRDSFYRFKELYQVANNLESQRRQYGLVERGHQLGWNDVQVIDGSRSSVSAQLWLCLSRNQRLPRPGDYTSAPGGSCWRGGAIRGHSKH